LTNAITPRNEKPPTADSELEARIAAAIDPWLAHMSWRKDFEQWREHRIRQELHQDGNLKDVRAALGPGVAGKMLLDLGAGMGGLSVAILRELQPQGLRLQAMDYNREYCNIARLRAERYGLELPIVVAAGEALPYPDESFDLIVCLDVLEHVGDAEGVLLEIYRSLKPGGTVLTTVPNRRAFRDPHYHLPLINWLPRQVAEWFVARSGHGKSGGLLQDRQGLSELNTYTWGRFKRLASDLGFEVRDQVYWRIRHGEVRHLRGMRRKLLNVAVRSRLFEPIYRAYRYGWQGTYQIRLVKPF
jgi:2-polyprenyl-3-methyl-5-hydroxy-6-metoxy-1,4-benzoquinol methylase